MSNPARPDPARPDPRRIAKVSNWLFQIATALTYMLPLVMFFAIVQGWFDPASLPARFPVLSEGTPVTALQGTLVAGVAVVVVLPLIAVFMAMASLFNRYRRGDILSNGCADDILRVGRAMILVAVATVLGPTVQILVLSWNAPQRALSISLDGGTLGFVLSAGLLTVIGWAMREAAQVKAENEGFV